jgi:GntR family transcriptional regulator/MocR family aminotransferase
VPLLIPLAPSTEPLFRQIYKGLRDAILGGTLPEGDRLPSSRDLADQLGVSRTIVVMAYEQLLAEGFVTARHGSGTYVAPVVRPGTKRQADATATFELSRYGKAATQARSVVDLPPNSRRQSIRYDFAYSKSDVEVFPFETWRRLLIRNTRKATARDFDYAAASGHCGLRESVCSHVRRSRSVVCDPAQVIIVNGSQQGLDLLTRVLIDEGDAVAIEDPQYQGTREVLRVAGARLLPVPVDGSGIDTSTLPKAARLLFTTPSHQFPTGAILPLSRRWELLRWAERTGAFIVEDDYDGEFRYDDKPLESLQGLDTQGRVIYMGTFSRTVYPALRIGYLVVPVPLIHAVTAAKWLSDRHTATLEQQTLADFIASGMYERHLRQVRRRNTARRDVLLEAIQKHLGDRVRVTGDGAGTHVVLWPRTASSEEDLISRAAQAGVGVYAISGYYLRTPAPVGLLLGFARLREPAIKEGIKRLSGIL